MYCWIEKIENKQDDVMFGRHESYTLYTMDSIKK